MIIKPDGNGRRLLALLAFVVVGAGILSLSRHMCCHKAVEVKPPAAVEPQHLSKDDYSNVDFGPYMADLQRRIKRAWFPPRGHETRHGKVVFKVDHDGTMRNLRMIQSTKIAAADVAMMNAIQNASPFKELPPGAPKDVDIEFTFDYNVFSGGNPRSY